jgi:hypothetical protein
MGRGQGREEGDGECGELHFDMTRIPFGIDVNRDFPK